MGMSQPDAAGYDCCRCRRTGQTHKNNSASTTWRWLLKRAKRKAQHILYKEMQRPNPLCRHAGQGPVEHQQAQAPHRKETMSARLSYSAPKALLVLVSRATLPIQTIERPWRRDTATEPE